MREIYLDRLIDGIYWLFGIAFHFDWMTHARSYVMGRLENKILCITPISLQFTRPGLNSHKLGSVVPHCFYWEIWNLHLYKASYN